MKICFQLLFLNVNVARNINIYVVTFYITLTLCQQLNIVKYIDQQLCISAMISATLSAMLTSYLIGKLGPVSQRFVRATNLLDQL